MVTRHRLNLSMSEIDYQRLVDLAAAEGKMPSTFALDCLKVVLHARGAYISKRIKAPLEQPKADTATRSLPGIEKQPGALPGASLTRQQRREQERRTLKKAKGGK